jgi:large subunit ribosomal protein L47
VNLGRAWTDEELRYKSFDDMHRLWWSCLREQNRLLTENFSRAAINIGYGKYEANKRIKEVHKTQKAIKRVLVERWDAWEDAKELQKDDPEVISTESGMKYVPMEQPERNAGRKRRKGGTERDWQRESRSRPRNLNKEEE